MYSTVYTGGDEWLRLQGDVNGNKKSVPFRKFIKEHGAELPRASRKMHWATKYNRFR